jgi:hypothetical protein
MEKLKAFEFKGYELGPNLLAMRIQIAPIFFWLNWIQGSRKKLETPLDAFVCHTYKSPHLER